MGTGAKFCAQLQNSRVKSSYQPERPPNQRRGTVLSGAN
ncbi:hypothetical protein NK6_6628 [Bradyrhizobium diazoefficiens]|uniref:Uncharacterized protein n=1 Tax=Bradyrhizobium diazoefficiens TaxID=1355477 RepID=A0A0E4BTG1_9BRAD|nr:hypothetical protein NK6_6628 [Bradyrhizobium diazoefficiens]